MHRLVTLTILLAVAPATAQPVLAPQPCDVHIARAPDDVRAVIETWVRAEQHCSTTLEVRVVPTDGGLYLFARDSRGYVRERIVPDAQSAGVLVASWVADDSIAPVLVIEQPRPDPMREPSLNELLLLPRGPGMHDTMVRARGSHRRPFGLGLVAGAAINEGAVVARFDLEVPLKPRTAHGGGWMFVGSLGLAATEFTGGNNYETAVWVNAREVRVGTGLARVWAGRNWQLRARAGLLVRFMMKTDEYWHWDPMSTYTAEYSEEMAALWGGEAALLASRRIGDRWALIGGPIVGMDAIRDGLPDVSYGPEVTLFGGVTYTQ